MPLEYLSSNELKKYPFVDSLSLKDTDGNILPNACIADILVVINDPNVKFVSLMETQDVGTGIAVLFESFDFDEISLGSITMEIEKVDVSLHSQFVGNDNYITVKLVTGSEFLNIGSRVFDKSNTKLTVDAIRPYMPRIETLTFMNLEEVVKQFSKEKILGTEVRIKEGTNIGFYNDGVTVSIDVNPGLGAGLYNPCGSDLVIKTINNIKPDSFQNFLLDVDECYETTKGYQGETEWISDYGITIENTCKPRCTSDQLGAFAHYLNRVKDGMETIASYATDITTQISNMIDDFNNDTTRILPFIKAAVTRFDNPYGRAYYSFIVSFFNKTDAEIAVTTDITIPTELVERSARFKQGARTTEKLSVNITDSVPCHQQGRFEFAIKGETGQVVTINATAGLATFSQEFTLT